MGYQIYELWLLKIQDGFHIFLHSNMFVYEISHKNSKIIMVYNLCEYEDLTSKLQDCGGQ